MARVSASVSLEDCTITHNSQSIRYAESEAFRAFERVFRPVQAAPPGDSEIEGRAKKRRKLPNGGHANVEESFDPKNSAVLARVSLDLVSGYLYRCVALCGAVQRAGCLKLMLEVTEVLLWTVH